MRRKTVPYRVSQLLIGCLCAVLLVLPGRAHAIAITFNLQALGGQQYRYIYSVTNDGSLGAGMAVALFDIAFDPVLYDAASLHIVTPNPPASQWSEVILAPAPGVPAAYDALALTGGIPVGATVAGFAVDFAWLGGPGGPGAQPFQVSDPVTFQPLPGGGGTTTAVPEPSTTVLLILGLLSLAWCRTTYGDARV
jgi:hypothetical protein